MECKNPRAALEEGVTNGISTMLRINCKTCDAVHDKAYHQYQYLKRKDAYEKEEAAKEAKENAAKEKNQKTYFLLEYAKKKLAKLRKKKFNRISRPSFAKHISAREKSNYRLEDFELNLRAVMASFYIGSGCEDVASVISFLGLPGGKSLARGMSNKAEVINDNLIAVCKEAVAEGLKMEIAATICEKLDGKYTKKKR